MNTLKDWGRQHNPPPPPPRERRLDPSQAARMARAKWDDPERRAKALAALAAARLRTAGKPALCPVCRGHMRAVTARRPKVYHCPACGTDFRRRGKKQHWGVWHGEG